MNFKSMIKQTYRNIMPDKIRARISNVRKILRRRNRIYMEYLFGYERYPYKTYCDKYKCIFIHIPKNAGTSIITLLNDNKEIEQEHNSYWDYMRSDAIRFGTYEMFCVVRNPWDRLFSAYKYLSSGGNKGSDQYLTDSMNKQCTDFQDFVMNWISYDRIYNITVLNPQFIYIYDFQNEKVVVNNILRFESLSEEFTTIQSKLGVPGRLPWVNKSENYDYQESYTDDMVKVVADFYSFDIQLFNYQFKRK